MSRNALEAVARHSRIRDRGAYDVLLAVAYFTNGDGENAYPSIELIAHQARLDERTVRRLLSPDGELIQSGELVARRGRGRGHTHSFQISESLMLAGPRRKPDTAPAFGDEKTGHSARFNGHARAQKPDSVSTKPGMVSAKTGRGVQIKPGTAPPEQGRGEQGILNKGDEQGAADAAGAAAAQQTPAARPRTRARRDGDKWCRLCALPTTHYLPDGSPRCDFHGVVAQP